MTKYSVEIWVPPIYVDVTARDEDEAFAIAQNMIDDEQMLLSQVSIGACEVGEICEKPD